MTKLLAWDSGPYIVIECSSTVPKAHQERESSASNSEAHQDNGNSPSFDRVRKNKCPQDSPVEEEEDFNDDTAQLLLGLWCVRVC